MLDKISAYFKIDELNSRLSTEIVAGITTFMTMAYIIFLQPLVLSGVITNSPTGMDQKALMVGVCLAAAFGSILMGVLANYPIGLAPGMGENFFFVSVVAAIVSHKIAPPETAWQTALGVVFVSGLIFTAVSLLNVREMIMNAISPSLKFAIAAGIGLFIALLGLRNGGIIYTGPSGFYNLDIGNLKSITVLIFLVGLCFMGGLQVLKVRGGILWGILLSTALALVLGKISFVNPVSMPPSVAPIFAKLDLVGVIKNITLLLPFIIIFTFMDLFDTIGTLIGITTQAGLMKDNKLPRARRAFMADSIATLFGTICGNSTVTCYIESATGIAHGGRTGLTAVSTGLCFLLALFFAPFVGMVANYPDPGLNPIIAPALVIVGAMMMQSIAKIDWEDYSEAIPAFLILAGIPFTFSIADGLTLGFITYPIIKVIGGKSKEIGWLTYLIAIMLILYLVFVKSAM